MLEISITWVKKKIRNFVEKIKKRKNAECFLENPGRGILRWALALGVGELVLNLHLWDIGTWSCSANNTILV